MSTELSELERYKQLYRLSQDEVRKLKRIIEGDTKEECVRKADEFKSGRGWFRIGWFACQKYLKEKINNGT